MDAIHDAITTASTAEVVDLDGDYDVVRVDNRGTTDPIYANVGGTAAGDDPAVPTVGGRGTLVIPPGEHRDVLGLVGSPTRVRVVCAATHAYSVSGFDRNEYPG